MGYDKLIDSARLDAAMTATADAIREKAGGSGKIAWDADNGFADKIAKIKGYYVGSIMFDSKYYTEGEGLVEMTGGFGFKPSRVFLYASDPLPSGWLNSSTCLYIEYDGIKTTCYRATAALDGTGSPRIVVSKEDGSVCGISIDVNHSAVYVRVAAEHVNSAIDFDRNYTLCVFG